jgi:hypothetical protein
VKDIWSDYTYNEGVVDMRIIASVTFVALLSATTTVPALADQFDWGPLNTQPRDDQNTIWDAHCNDSSEHVVSGQCTITSGSGTLQNVGGLDLRVGTDRHCDSTSALLKMIFIGALVPGKRLGQRSNGR